MKKGFFVSVGSLVSARVYLAVSQVAVLPIIAAYLSVADFAIMASAMTVIVFSLVLSDSGMGRSLIRSAQYDPEEWSSVFWLLTAVGVALFGLIWAVAPVWAGLFDTPEIVTALAALSFVPGLQAMSAVPNAELERRERYPALAVLRVVSTTVGLVVAIVLAIQGYGVWALIYQQIAMPVVRFFGLFWLSLFRPRLVFDWGKVKGHLGFARDSLAVAAIQAVQAQAAVVLIGLGLGQVALGLYAMAERFNRLPTFGFAGPASSVVFVRMAKVKEDLPRVAAIYLAAVRLSAIVLVPPILLVAVSSSAIFTVLLSEKWEPAASVFALSIGGFTLEAVTAASLACVFRATGRTPLQVRLMVERTIVKVAMIGVGVMISLHAAAAAFLISAVVMAPRGWVLAQRCAPIDAYRSATAMLIPTAVSAAVALGHLALVATFEPSHLGEMLMAMVAAAIALGLSIAVQLGAVREAVREFNRGGGAPTNEPGPALDPSQA